MSYMGVLVLLSLLVVVHEGGHLIAAKWVRIPIASFSIGIGPKLWARRWGSTEYALRLLPLGGFVLPDVAGESDFRRFSLPRRIAFFLGGPLANLSAALPLCAIHGLLKRDSSPCSMLAGQCWEIMFHIPRFFAQPEAISGLVGIMVEGGKVTQAGMGLEFAIFMTVSVAVVNLLPIPLLDGGQIVVNSLEELCPRVIRLRTTLTTLGVSFLGGLMIYANGHDVIRYWG